MHPAMRRRNSLSKAPDYSTKRDVADLASGKKKSFEEVNYLPASDGSKKRCHECANYLKPGQAESDCAKVISIVKAEGVCDLFKQRDYHDDVEPEPKPTPTEIVIRLNGG